jgi:PAS domain S-box-containing protein
MSTFAIPPAPAPLQPASDDEPARLRARLAELERHVDEMQAIAALGSYQWFVPEDRLVWSAEQLRIHGLDAASHPRNLAEFLACIHPDDRAAAAAQLETLLSAGHLDSSYRIVRPDGTVRTVQARNSVERDGAGAPVRVFGTVQDVTHVAAVEAELRAANERLEQRVAERTAELQRSEEHFRRLTENAHDLIVIVDERGTALYGSPSVQRILGHDPAEYAGQSLAPFFHPDDAPRVGAWLAGLADAAGTTQRLELRFRHLDGRWVHLEAVSTPRPGYAPGAGHVINLRDVTERQAAEEALRAAEERWRAMLDNAHDVVTILDPAGRMGYQSPALTRVFGYTPEELEGRSAFDYMHPDDAPRVAEQLARVLAEPGSVGHAEYRFLHKDGTWREVEAFGRTLSPHGPDEGVVANIRDVTERREAERALQRREEHFRRLIENGSDLLMISGPDMALTYVSPSAERLLGYTPEEMLAKRPEDLLHPDDVPAVYAGTQEILDTPGTVRRLAWRIRHKDGRWRLIEAIGRTIDPRSAADGVVANGRDVTEQRETELALQRSEEHFRALIERSYDLVQVLDPQGRVIYTGPSVQRLLGYTPEEIAGGAIPDFMHPDDLPAAAELVGRVLANPGTSGSLEYRVRHKDGSWRWLEAYARTLSPTSAEQGIVANARDITERREAERALRESEEYFRRLIENGSDLLIISAPDGALTYVSPSVERLLGYAPHELLGNGPGDLLHPEDLPAVEAALAAMIAAPGTTHRVSERIRHKDGSWRYFHVVGRTLSPDTAADGLVCSGRDVTEQRAAEEALQRSEEHFRRLIENGSDLLLISAAAGALTYVSPSAERLLGYAPQALLGSVPEDLVHPDDVERVRDVLRTVGEAPGTVHRVAWRIRHQDGRWRVIEALARTLSPDSVEAGFVINGRDVTEQRAQEAELRQAKAEAEQAREEAERANRAKSEFLSRMSHELRTPLNSILGFAQVLEDLDLPPEYRGGVRHILNGGRHLLDLINEVLDIARIEADQQPLSLEPVRVGAVVHEAVDMVRPLAAARDVWVGVVPHPADARYVRADRQRLTQVLLNLLSNAVKYNRPAGAVRIGVEPAPGGEGRLRIRVSDEGAGIAPERQAELFVPFARLGAEHTGVEGTGLGLALSQRLAHAMGGTLALERSGADGSVFAVELPPAEDPLADAPALAARAARAGDAAATYAPATLLYVEDNLANLSLVETILRPRPAWRLVPALQGGLGLELAAEHAPDIVLLDLHLPDMPGREVLRRLRADARTAHVPVVVISADATPRTIDALRQEGADAFLTKPLDVRVFLATVERLLARPR